MEDEFTECSTGILVDIEDKLDDKLSMMSLNVEKPENYILNGLNLNGGSNYKLLGAELNIRRDVFSTPKNGWKTPSPKSMKMIKREACRIIDQLHSSPIESVEAQLIDEDFPTPFSLDGCTSDSSPESENTCAKCVHSIENKDSLSKVTTSASGCVDESPIKLEPEPTNGVTEESPIQNQIKSDIEKENRSTIQNKIESPIQNKCESSIQNEIESLIENKKDPIKNGNESPIKNGNESPIKNGKESPVQTEIESPIQKESDSSSFQEETVIHIQVEDLTVSPTNMVPSTFKSEPANKNELKTPLSKRVLGKENLSIKKDASKLRFTNNQSSLMKKGLIEPNLFIKPNSIPNGKTPIKESVRKDKAYGIPEKSYSAKKIQSQTPGMINRRNSILPQLASTMPSLPGPSPISALSKTSKMVTPVPKFVRRTQSFQSDKPVSKNPGTVASSVSSKNFQSGIGSIRKDSKPVVKSRLSCQIPSTGNPSYTPVSRSKSFPKNSGTLSSRISRPSLSGAHKVDSAKPSQISDPDRSVLSTSSRIRFTSRLYLPSPLPDSMNMNLPRQLFPDVKPKRR